MSSLGAPSVAHQQPARSGKAIGYREDVPSRASVYALAEPDFSEPLPLPARVGLQWHGDEWAEIDPETGEVLATGSAGADASRHRQRLQGDLA